MVAIDINRGRWSPSTRRAYESFWRDWESWCRLSDEGWNPLPSDAKAIAGYLNHCAERGLSTASIAGRLAAILAVNSLYGNPINVKATVIRDAWAEIRRAKGTRNTPKQALPAAAMTRIIKGIPEDRLQDRAILLVGFKSAMRRSEIVALNREDLDITEAGVHITIRHSKTDKTGKGEVVTIARTPTAYCAVAALEAWLTNAGTTDGPIFRSAAGLRMAAPKVAAITKRWAAKAGFDPKLIGAHSLRSGCITTMQEAKVDLKAGMEHSRHRTPQIYLGYAQVKRGLDSQAVKALGI